MLVLAIGAATASLAQATTIYNFTCITDNGNGCASLAPQLTLTVSDVEPGEVLFTISNAGPIASLISEIYWKDPANLLSAFDVPTFFPSAADVVFVVGATPGHLPGDTSFNEFATSAAVPSPSNGINIGDSLGIRFAYSGSYADIISALSAGTLQTGIHVQAIGTQGGSDSLILVPGGQDDPVPEPATLALMGAGLIGLALVKRRRAGV